VGIDGNGYALTQAARAYVSPESPFFDSVIYQVSLSRENMMALRHDSASEAARSWKGGRAHDPELTAMAMHRMSFPLGFALASNGVNVGARVLDVAGGAGSVSIGLALSLPNTEFTVLELPGSTDVAERLIAAYGLGKRISCVAAEMFEDAWPTGFDTVIFCNVLHDWDADRCATLMSKAFGAICGGGSVLVLEALMCDDGPSPLWTSHLSFGMALEMEGRQFTAGEITRILASAGFGKISATPLLGHYSAVVGRRLDANVL
jgi:hypothetical protein